MSAIPRRERPAISFLSRCLLLSLATAFLLLALLGVLIPGLPTTPFLLLTSCCLVRSSPRLNTLLLQSRIFGPILSDWQIRGGVQKRVKAKAMVIVVLAVAFTSYFADAQWQKTLVIGLASVGLLVIVRIPAVEEESGSGRPSL